MGKQGCSQCTGPRRQSWKPGHRVFPNLGHALCTKFSGTQANAPYNLSRWWISSAPFVKTCEWALEKPHWFAHTTLSTAKLQSLPPEFVDAGSSRGCVTLILFAPMLRDRKAHILLGINLSLFSFKEHCSFCNDACACLSSYCVRNTVLSFRNFWSCCILGVASSKTWDTRSRSASGQIDNSSYIDVFSVLNVLEK